MPNVSYIAFIKRIYPNVLRMIFEHSDCLYDKPLGVLISMNGSFGNRATGVADLQFGGNVITIQLPELINLYDRTQFNTDYNVDLIATDIVAALIHEAFHINQVLDLGKFYHDPYYKNIIEGSNTAASDKWMLEHIMQLNKIVTQNHPYYYGLGMQRILDEFNYFINYLDMYQLKTMEQSITEKIKMMYPEEYVEFLTTSNSMISFIDGKQIITKYHDHYDCDQVIKCLPDLNRLLYAVNHGCPRLIGEFKYSGDSLNCKLDTTWENIEALSFNEFEF